MIDLAPRRGRPRLAVPRTSKITTYFTDEEYQRLLETAARRGVRVHDLVRRAVLAMLDTPGPAFTPRELEVMGLIAEGHSNHIIGLKLDITEHTVKYHAMNVMAKLGVDSRAGVAAEAVRLGLA